MGRRDARRDSDRTVFIPLGVRDEGVTKVMAAVFVVRSLEWLVLVIKHIGS